MAATIAREAAAEHAQGLVGPKRQHALLCVVTICWMCRCEPLADAGGVYAA